MLGGISLLNRVLWVSCCRAEVKMAASNDFGKAAAKAAFVALPFLGSVIGPMVAGAKIDYEGKSAYLKGAG